MSMFSLTHNLLLCSLCDAEGVRPEDTFRVLGDDVVIAHDGVAERYKTTVSLLGIPISWNKTHTSDSYAEFAGASITRSIILRPGKWSTPNKKNWASLALELRAPLKGEVPIAWRQAQKLLLFKAGHYDPESPDKWPFWIKASSLVDSQTYDAWVFKSTAPWWYYTIMDKWTDTLWKECRVFPGFVPKYPPPSVNDAIKPLLAQVPDESATHQAKDMARWYGKQLPLVMSLWHGYLLSDLAAGLISFEKFEALVAEAEVRANALLYQPPANKGPRDHVLLDHCLRALDKARQGSEALCAA
jgi:hypothetical protein